MGCLQKCSQLTVFNELVMFPTIKRRESKKYATIVICLVILTILLRVMQVDELGKTGSSLGQGISKSLREGSLPSVVQTIAARPKNESPKENRKYSFDLPEGSEEVEEIYRKEKERLRLLMSNEDREAEEVIDKYLAAREKGIDPTRMAEHVFNYRLPNARNLHTWHQTFPFVSSFVFAAFADIMPKYGSQAITRWKTQGISGLKDGCVIYLNGVDVEQFSVEVAPNITKRFILLTHESWPSMPKKLNEVLLLDHPKLIRWFAKNPSRYHPKLEALPVGLYPQRTRRVKLDYWDSLLRSVPPTFTPSNHVLSKAARPHLAFLNFKESNHKVRSVALKSFQHFGHTVTNQTKQVDFYKTILQSKFVVSPPGWGEDTYRCWEAILLGAIPIVRSSTLDPILRLAPAYILQDYQGPLKAEQFENYTVPTTSRRMALAPYWFDRINSYRDK